MNSIKPIGVDIWDKINRKLEFYVYIYIDPRNESPFYVGKGSGDRYLQHLKTAKSNSYWKDPNKIKINKIRKILSVGLEPTIDIITCNSEEDSFLLEKSIIEKYGRIDNNTGVLTNLSDGGEGQSGWIPDVRYRNNMSESTRGEKNGMFGRNHSEESRDKIRMKNIGRKPNDETRKKMSDSRTGELNGFFGKKHSDDTITKISENRKGKLTLSENPSAVKYIFISPSGNQFIVHGYFEKFCDYNSLSVGRMKRFIGKGRIPPCNRSHNMTTQFTINCEGWEVKKFTD